MAKTLAAFPSEDESQRRNRYPWGDWLNGEVWELRKGTPQEVEAKEADFSVTTKSFRSAVMQASGTRNGDVRTAVLDGGEKLVIQFLPGETLTEDSE